MISFEKSFNPEIPTKEKVTQLFKQQGESSEAIEAYKLWFTQMQKEADESKSLYSRLELNIEVADLLVESNLVFDAGVYLDDAWDMMENEMSRFSESSIASELIRLHEKLSLVTAKFK